MQITAEMSGPAAVDVPLLASHASKVLESAKQSLRLLEAERRGKRAPAMHRHEQGVH